MQQSTSERPYRQPLEQYNPDFGSVPDSCFLRRWLSLYTFIPLFKSLVRPLARSDITNIPASVNPSANYNQYCAAKKAVAPQKQHNILYLLLGKLMFWDLAFAGLLALLVAALAFTGPLMIERIMVFLNDPNASLEQQNQAYFYALVWISMFLLRIFMNAYCQRTLTFMAVKAQHILTVELFEKIVKLEPSYRVKHESSRIKLLEILTAEVASVTSFIKSSPTLITAPATLIGVQVFLFLQVGLYGLSLVVVVIIAVALQIYLKRKMQTIAEEKGSVMAKRTLANMEMLYGIQSLKRMGWESLITSKNLHYRTQQNMLNRRQYLYLNLFNLTANLVPVLTVFPIFGMLLLNDQQIGLETTLVYTVLSFVGLTVGPVTEILGVVTSAKAGINSLKYIDEFLKNREVANFIIHDSSLEPGTLIMKDLVATWLPFHEEGQPNEALPTQAKSKSEQNSLNQPLLPRVSPESLWADKRICYDEAVKRLGFALGISITLELKKGQRLILVSRPKSGKTSFLQSIIGNLHVLSGSVRFGGRIGYLPQVLWSRKLSVRDNILFGEPYDRKKLDIVYRMVLLKADLKYFKQGEQTIMNQSSELTEGQQRKIALARVLYSEPDLLLLDEAFAGMDPQTARQIYDNICEHYKNSTVVLSTHVTYFIRKEDHVLLLQDGVVVRSGTMAELTETHSADIRQCHRSALRKEDQSQIMASQIAMRDRRKAELRRKVQSFIRYLVSLTKGMTRDEVDNVVFKQADIRKQRKIEARKLAHRVQPMDSSNYRKYFKLAPLSLHVALFFLSLIIQAVKIFSNWWIGSVASLPWPISQNQALYIYVGLIAIFGLALALNGSVSPIVSSKAATKLTGDLCRSVAHADWQWHSKVTCLKAAAMLNHDDAEIYQATSLCYSLLRDVLTFVATIVLVGLSSPIFLLLASGVIVLDVAVFYVYGRAAAELDEFDGQYHDPLVRTYEELINGIDLLKAFGKLSNPRNSILKHYYDYTAYRLSRKYLDVGLTLLTEITSLGIIAGAAFFSVHSKFNEDGIEQDVAIVGTSIAFSMNITGLVTGLSWSATNFKASIANYVAEAYSVIDQQPEEGYFELEPPADWPTNSSVKFEGVTIESAPASKIRLNMINLNIASGQKIYLAGRDQSGAELILKGCSKELCPTSNHDRSTGTIKIGEVDLKRIGRKYLARKVAGLSSVPFVFTGSLQENIDPFGQHTVEQIRRCLELARAWQSLKIGGFTDDDSDTKARLEQIIPDAGYYMSLGLIQQINIARALLSKPEVILWDNAASSLDEATELDVVRSIRKELPKTTMLMLSHKLTTAIDLDRIIYFSNGRIKEDGEPRYLLQKNECCPFRRMVEASGTTNQIIDVIAPAAQRT